mgnify:FL=1
MPLEVHYTNDKSWNPETEKFDDPKLRNEADDIGHLLMAIGITEVTDLTIPEIVIRTMILDRLYRREERSSEVLTTPLKRHVGLKIEGRWAGTETRWKFTSRHAKGMVRDITNMVLN